MRQCNCGGTALIGKRKGEYFVSCVACMKYCGRYSTIEFTKKMWDLKMIHEWEEEDE